MQVRTFLMMIIVTVGCFHCISKSDQRFDRKQAPKRPKDVADERVASGPDNG